MSRIGNVSLDRENKRLKLAIKQSETEKLEWKKRHEEQTETLQAVLKENNVLHETIRLKNSIEETQNDECVVIDNDEWSLLSTRVQEKTLECWKCEFTTKRQDYFRSHNIVKHQKGQYQCEWKECKKRFVRKEDIDKHTRDQHQLRNAIKKIICKIHTWPKKGGVGLSKCKLFLGKRFAPRGGSRYM